MSSESDFRASCYREQRLKTPSGQAGERRGRVRPVGTPENLVHHSQAASSARCCHISPFLKRMNF